MHRYLGFLIASLLFGATVVTHSDLGQTSSFPDTILTTTNVNTSTFGKVGLYSVDVPIFAQPLGVAGVSIGGAIHNVVIVASVTNRLYAFDADQPNSKALWTIKLGPTRVFFPGKQVDLFTRFTEVGIMGTPVIDTTAGFVYVVAALPTSWRLFQVSLSTGTIVQSVDIAGQVTGTGDTGEIVIAGRLQFNYAQHFQRPGLTLANSKVYIAFGSFEDLRPWHGWLFAYNAADLSQAAVFCTTPNTWGGAIWQSGAAPSVDASGNLYVTTGNGAGGASNGVEFSESVLKLSPTLALLDYFTPASYITLDAGDFDVSSAGVILIPGTNNAVAAGKDFSVYVLDTGCLGHVQGSSLCALQTFKTSITVASSTTGAYGMTMLNNTLYVPSTSGTIAPFPWTGTALTTTSLPLSSSYGFPGPQVSSSNGILWSVTAGASSEFSPAAATLRAIRAADLTELWNSDQTVGDSLGHLTKFVSPLIFNGRVYVPNQDGQIQVYGLH